MGRGLLVVLALLFLGWTAATSLTRVQPGERAVIRRFGRILEAKPEQGLYIGWPWGIDRVEAVKVGEARRIQVGFVSKEDSEDLVPIGQMLTGDHNLVNVQAEVNFKVRDDQPEKFLLQADNIDALVARSAEAFLAEWIAARTVDDVLVRGKIVLPGVLRDRLQERLDQYDLGMEIERVSITRLAPPDQVKDVFERLAQVHTSVRTREIQASQEAARSLASAEAKKYRMLGSARAYASEELVKAAAEANSFRTRLHQYRELSRQDPDYLNALWLQEMTQLYAQMQRTGRIDLLDHHLSSEGITITQFPLQPRKR